MPERKKPNAKEGLVAVLDNPASVKITLSGKTKADKAEMQRVLRLLGSIRPLGDIETLHDNGELVIGTSISERPAKELIAPEEPIVTEHKTKGGMRLTLTTKPDGRIYASLEEDLELPKSRDKLRHLTDLIKTLTTVTNSGESTAPGRGSEKQVIEMLISDVHEFKGPNATLLREIMLYQYLQDSLERAIREVGKQTTTNPDEVADAIQYYTNLAAPQVEKQLLLTDLAYFMRELYGVIQAETNVTMDHIRSKLKSRSISENRHAAMHVVWHRFHDPEDSKKGCKGLSSSDIGRVFGPYGGKKNHATVLLAVNRKSDEPCPYDASVGLPLKAYRDKRRNARSLYLDTVEKRIPVLIRTRGLSREKAKELFQFKE